MTNIEGLLKAIGQEIKKEVVIARLAVEDLEKEKITRARLAIAVQSLAGAAMKLMRLYGERTSLEQLIQKD